MKWLPRHDSERAALLGQWWNALEAWRGSHFLVNPATKSLGNGDELRSLLSQWWNHEQVASAVVLTARTRVLERNVFDGC